MIGRPYRRDLAGEAPWRTRGTRWTRASDSPRTPCAALQLERLRATLRHAYDNVPLLPGGLRQGGRAPRTAASLGDLARFPFTTKADLRDQYPFGMFAVPQGAGRRIHASSGTTGRPTVVGYTERDLTLGRTWWPGRSARPAAGPGDKVHVAYGYGLFTGGLGAHYGAERLGCTVDPGVRRHDRAGRCG